VQRGVESDLRVAGFRFIGYLESMKTTIDIPEKALADAMRYTGAKTKREAVVKVLEEYNRRQMVEKLIASFGTLDFGTNDELEAGDLEEISLKETAARKP
jgi:hypothetical protein